LMHATVSGTAEYLAEDDVDGVRLVRELVANLGWEGDPPPAGPPPLYDPEDLLAIMPKDGKKPVDMREIVARIADASEFLEFKPLYGPATLCLHAKICGMPVGIVTNNGPLDPDGSTKATHFIQACCQADLPLIYLQNTTGYIVGVASERAGMIKHGSKMIQAVANASVPQITIMCGASYGAGNYGMCGRGFSPDFLFAWPNALTAVMGPEQAALTMAIVMEDGAKARGEAVDTEAIAKLRERIVATFERQMSAFYLSGAVLDDGVIDPRDTRAVIGMALSVCLAGRRRKVKPLNFGVARQ
jgi:geranyl-CoA carboxylase beta subunit